jgi:hypothetical protein
VSHSSATPARRAVPAAAVGVALFLLACVAPGIGLYTEEVPADIKLFRSFGERTLAGEIPYDDIFIEYPPAALPAFVLPSLGPADEYVLLFKALQIAFGAALVATVALILALLGATRNRLYLATAFAALAPLALGPTVLNRYDLWPAALLAAALAALIAGRTVVWPVLLALAILAKGYAIVVLPVALLYVLAHSGRAAVKRAVVAGLATAFVVVLPFAVTGPGGLRHSLTIQTNRGLHLESLAGSLLAAGDRLGIYSAKVVSGFAFEFDGRLPDIVASLATLVQLAAVAATWVLFHRGPATPERLVLAAATAVVAFTTFGKVLSPQFLIWLVPLVALLGGLAAPTLLLAALGLTQWFFPGRYGDVTDLGGSTWIVLARNLVLIALFAVLASRLRTQRE